MAQTTRRMAEKLGGVTLRPVYQLLRPNSISSRTLNYVIKERLQTRRHLKWLVNATGVATQMLLPFARLAIRANRFLAARTPPASPLIEVSRHDHVDIDTWTSLWTKFKAVMPATCDRSWQFYEWRYEHVPDLRYGFSVAKRNSEVVGILVWRRPLSDELNVGTIFDILADPNDLDVVTALLGDALDVLSATCESVVTGTSHRALLAVLKNAGFLLVKRHCPTVVSSKHDTRRLFENHAEAILFSKADHDWDQIHVAI